MKSLLPAVFKQNNKNNKNKPAREAPEYKARHAFYLAFFSSKLYVDVVRRWRGLGVLYFFIMLSVMTFPHAIQLMWSLNQVIETKILTPLKSLPPLSIRSGEVFFDRAMPYLIKNKNDEVISIIDTEGHINQLPDPNYPLASILVTKHDMHVNFRFLDFLYTDKEKKLEDKDSVIPWESIENEDFWITSWLDTLHIKALKNICLIAVYPIVVSLNASVFMTILLSMVLFAQFTARMAFKIELSFFESSRLLFVASTPLAVICSVLVLFDGVIPGKGFVYVALLALYFCFGVIAYRQASRMIAVR
ncbi:MAG: DUF1189 family protein [Legionellaceae bacterium]|nr:DUF1189 family protein [Legionellaceae bacterium]